ncbi:MAG: hypothetical protein KGI11_07235 [Thaumarchaeota archaeon]|nr:hypothetical protein [Nitrososphaerota archaeon]
MTTGYITPIEIVASHPLPITVPHGQESWWKHWQCIESLHLKEQGYVVMTIWLLEHQLDKINQSKLK